MKPPAFAYVRASTPDDVVAGLAEFGDEAKVIAGGQSLVPMMNLRLARPSALVDINRVSWNQVETRDGRLHLGATVRQRRLLEDPDIGRAVPLLPACASFIAHPAIRNRGTVCGSLCHADPTAELPVVAVATDAILQVASPRGAREVPAADFFFSAFMTVLEPDEVVTGVSFPVRTPDERSAFVEIAERAGDFAVAAVAVRLRVGDGRISNPRVVLGGAGTVPVRSTAGEQALAGVDASEEAVRTAAAAVADSIDPPADIHASSEFRRHLIRVLVARGLRQVLGRQEEA